MDKHPLMGRGHYAPDYLPPSASALVAHSCLREWLGVTPEPLCAQVAARSIHYPRAGDRRGAPAQESRAGGQTLRRCRLSVAKIHGLLPISALLDLLGPVG